MMPQPHTSSPPSSLAPPSAGAPPMFSSEGLTASGGTGQQQLVISNGVLLAAVIFLFMVVVFVFLLYLYAKRYLGANPLLAPRPSSPSSRFVFVSASPLPQRGLPAAVLRSLPVTVFKEEEEGSLECAVCLSEVAGGEKVRKLPKCAHAFHVECIDMWFHSHDTCPLCRAPVVGLDALPREDPTAAAAESPAAFPTNVLFWGTHDDVTNAGGLSTPAPPLPPAAPSTAAASSSASGRSWNKESLVIDIPARAVSMTTPPTTSPLPSSRMPGLSADDMRSPVSARLRSLRRLLSRGKQAMVGTSYSPRGDIEQGIGHSEAARQLPKTPKTPPPSN